jgi:putative tryptophan/tyrosine transport system substrate-binding protein
MDREHTIGVLSAGFPNASRGSFFERLERLGRVDVRHAEGVHGRIDQHAADLIGADVDILVALDTPAAKAAASATSTIPIVSLVFGTGTEPPPNLVALDKNLVPEEQLFVLLGLLEANGRDTSRIGVLWNADNPAVELKLRQVAVAAQRHSVEVAIESLPIRAPEHDVASAMGQAAGLSGVIVLEDPFVPKRWRELLDTPRDLRLPVAYEDRKLVADGGLMSFGPDRMAMLARMTDHVELILRTQAQAGHLPHIEDVESELFVNVETARELGLTSVPETLAGYPRQTAIKKD